MRSIFVAASALSLVCGSAAVAGKKQEVTGLALQQIQARDFEAPKSVTFPAVMTVLQDSGYRISSAEKETGLITGSASTNSHMSWNLFFGFGRSKKTPVVSAFVEDRGTGSRIRLNFVLAKTKSSIYGMSSSDEEPITDPTVYRGAFEKIEKEIFVRQALNSPAAAAPAATPQVVPASAPQTAPSPQSAAQPTAAVERSQQSTSSPK